MAPLPSSDPARILIDAVTLQRGGTRVFDGLSLVLEEARIGLIGDNGAGTVSYTHLTLPTILLV